MEGPDPCALVRALLYFHCASNTLQDLNPPMPLDRLRSALFSRHKNDNLSQPLVMTTTGYVSARSPGLWSSSHEDFTCLRFYVWTGGDPGFTLTTARRSESSTTTFPLDEDAELRVDRVTALKVWEAGIRPGDVLETVSDKRVHTMDPEAAIVLVQMSKSPSIIRFRSPTRGTRVRFDILLGRQKLGVFFTGNGVHDIPVVTRIGSGRGSASPSGVRLGDILVAVNGKDAIATGLSTTTKYLETCLRPVRLTFERAAHDNNADGWYAGQTASEESGEHRRGSLSLHNTFSNVTISRTTRETASLRCREFLRSLVPAGVHSAQRHLLGAGNRPGIRKAPRDVLIEWETGPLGLTLLEDVISGVPVVNRLTGKGSSTNMERIQHGFQLYSVNGERTEGRRLDDLCDDLLKLPKPVKLVFRPPPPDDTSEEDDNSEHSSKTSSPSLAQDTSCINEVQLNEDAHRALVVTSAAQHRCSQRASIIREQYEYEVVWTATQLGLQLEIPHTRKEDKAGKTSSRRQYPIIHKILKESTLDLPGNAVGHLFVSVNNWYTSGLSTTELRTLLRVATRPAVLRFRRREGLPGFQRTFLSSSSYDTNEGASDMRQSTLGSAYSILWSEGKLGIIFGCYEDADQYNTLVVYVKRIGPGQALNSKLVAIGDILRSINGQDLPPKQKFKKTMHSLTNTRQPVTLGFRRLLVERCSDWNA